MTDEELTELARRVWPDKRVAVEPRTNGIAVVCQVQALGAGYAGQTFWMELLSVGHVEPERARNMLAAALHMLAQTPVHALPSESERLAWSAGFDAGLSVCRTRLQSRKELHHMIEGAARILQKRVTTRSTEDYLTRLEALLLAPGADP